MVIITRFLLFFASGLVFILLGNIRNDNIHASNRTESIQFISNETSKDSVLNLAQKNHKQILVLISLKKCAPCRELERKTLSQSTIINKINRQFIAVKFIGAPSASNSLWKLIESVKFRGYPTIIVFDEKGNEMGRLVGAQKNPQQFISKLDSVSSGQNHLDKIRKRYLDNPESIDHIIAYAEALKCRPKNENEYFEFLKTSFHKLPDDTLKSDWIYQIAFNDKHLTDDSMIYYLEKAGYPAMIQYQGLIHQKSIIHKLFEAYIKRNQFATAESLLTVSGHYIKRYDTQFRQNTLLYSQADLNLQKGDYSSAIRYLNQIPSKSYTDHRLITGKLQAYLGMADYSLAAKLINSLLMNDDKLNSYLLASIAEICLQKGFRPDLGIKCIQRISPDSVQLNQENQTILHNLMTMQTQSK